MRYVCNECKEEFRTDSEVHRCIKCGSLHILQLPPIVIDIDNKTVIEYQGANKNDNR